MSLKDLAKMINQANKVKTPEQQFISMLNETIGRLDVENVRIPTQTFKPSSIGGCPRIPYFQLIKADQDKKASSNPELVGMGESGTDRHERIQKAIIHMKRLGYDCEWIDVETYLKAHPVNGTEIVSKRGMETKLYNKIFNLSFMCDGIIRFLGQYYILEIKTETSFKFLGRVCPALPHEKQATCYSLCLGINLIMFLYENRDICNKKSFVVRITNEMKEEMVHKMETINSHIQLNTVPEKNKSDCKYCDYTEACAKL